MMSLERYGFILMKIESNFLYDIDVENVVDDFVIKIREKEIF